MGEPPRTRLTQPTPLITGMDPNVALFTAGLGTLILQLVTWNQVPVFLASSFAFIAATLGGLVAAGSVYTLLAGAVRLKGTGFIDRRLPPVVIGPVIVAIGLGLAQQGAERRAWRISATVGIPGG